MNGPAAAAPRVRILVQTDVPQHADVTAIFQITRAWHEAHGFEVDTGYRPVTIRPRPQPATSPEHGPRGELPAPDRPPESKPGQVPSVPPPEMAAPDGERDRPASRRPAGSGAQDDPTGGGARRIPGERPRRIGTRRVVVRGWIAEENIPALQRDFDLRRVSRDVRLDPFAPGRIEVDCERRGEPIGDVKLLVKKLGVDQIWARGYDGRGVVVGVVDGGITAHGRDVNPTELPAIPRGPATGPVVDGWPFDWGTTAVGWGQHGNMVAFGIQAVAPGATLWDIRIWEPCGSDGPFATYLSNAISGYREAIDRRRLVGEPHILSNSWGLYRRALDIDGEYSGDRDSAFALLVEEALDEGILVLFAAGNCGAACPFAECLPRPAHGADIEPDAGEDLGPGERDDVGPGRSIQGPNGHPRVMTIGAADLDDDWCGYTSQGPPRLYPEARKPDFCAYTRFAGYFPDADPVLRDFDGGTSAATAVAAGVVALLKQKRPDLTQEEAMAVLAETAEDIRVPGFDGDSGAGIIRAKAAFDRL